MAHAQREETMTASSELLPARERMHQDAPRASRPIRFTASGSEYFRIWLVNLALVVVTLGVYAPWARVRKLRYFYGHTLVFGSPLEFHARPQRLMPAHALAAVLLLAYTVAGEISTMAALVSAALLAAVWPALSRSLLQLRLSNTSWRGLPFRFEGSLVDSYLAWLPFAAPFLIFSVLPALDPGLGEWPASAAQEGQPTFLAALGLGFLALALFFSWGHWSLRRYQQANLSFGEWRSAFLVKGPGRFYAIAFTTGASMLGCIALLAFAVFVAIGLGASVRWIPWVLLALAAFAGTALFGAYAVARLQNLVWSNTRLGGAFALRSELSAGALAWLSAKNALLVTCTLGLYWPFAAVARARMRLQSITVDAFVDPDDIASAKFP